MHLNPQLLHIKSSLDPKGASPNSHRNLVSDVNIGMFRFRYLLHATQEFPFESRLNRKSIGSISIHIGTSSGGQNISTRSIYTISFIFAAYTQLNLISFNLCARLRKKIIITGCEQNSFKLGPSVCCFSLVFLEMK